MRVGKVYKYDLGGSNMSVVEMPEGAQIIHVAIQGAHHNVPTTCVWAIVDPDAPMERRYFRMLGTGDPLDLDLVGALDFDHVGTVLVGSDGARVWHYFEYLPTKEEVKP